MRIAQTDATLRKAAEAVQYEASMLGATLQLSLESGTWIDSTPREHSIANSLLHSFLIASRNLCHFLYSHNPQPTDIVAEDFFDDPDEWRNLRPDPIPDLADGSFVQLISRRLLHLTYDRAAGTKPTWTSFRIAWELAKALDIFVARVPKHRIPDDIIEDVYALVQTLTKTIAEWGSVDDVESVPLTTLWNEDGFWTQPGIAETRHP